MALRSTRYLPAPKPWRALPITETTGHNIILRCVDVSRKAEFSQSHRSTICHLYNRVTRIPRVLERPMIPITESAAVLIIRRAAQETFCSPSGSFRIAQIWSTSSSCSSARAGAGTCRAHRSSIPLAGKSWPGALRTRRHSGR